MLESGVLNEARFLSILFLVEHFRGVDLLFLFGAHSQIIVASHTKPTRSFPI
jgi:hypothetical protein